MEGLRNHSEATMKNPQYTLQFGDDGEAQTLHPRMLLSRDEVEAIFGISKRFLELAVRKNNGPVFVKVGRLTRYRVRDVETWITKNRYDGRGSVADQDGGS
jgi:predicted DNA-binding transcriptional regulator AlpA